MTGRPVSAADPGLPRRAAAEKEAVERHLRHLRLLGHSDGTVYTRRRSLARLASRLDVPLLDASAADLLTWREGLTVGPNQVAHYASNVRQFYEWAVAEGLVGSNPAAELPVPRRSRGLPRPIAESDLMAALDSAPPRIRLWLVLAGWAGLRACEIAGLRRESILENTEPPVLIVTAQATKGRRPRVVPLSRFAVDEIRLARLPVSGWAFPRQDGRPGPNRPSRVSQLANRHLHSLGIASTLHGLRHRTGTMAYRATKDLLAVQSLLGHADAASTQTYAAFDQQNLLSAVEALPVPRRLQAVPDGRAS